MEVQLTPEEQAQLVQVAQRTGRNAEEVCAFEAVEKGLASLDRGEYITHEKIGARIEKLFKS